MRITKQDRIIFLICAVIIIGREVAYYRIFGSGETINRVASHVDGFELKIQPGLSPLFGIHYAIWANYPFFTYGDDTYDRAGAGGVIIRKGLVRNTSYQVEELPDILGISLLRISDKATGDVIASRRIRSGQVEDGHGWEGQHAAEFVRKTLQTDAPIGGPVGTKSYPALPVVIDRLELRPKDRISDKSSCPERFKILRNPWPATLDTDAWRFMPQAPISGFACDSGYVLVSSRVYGK